MAPEDRAGGRSGTTPPDRLEGRVVRIRGGTYEVDTGEERLACSLRGRVKRKDDRIVSVGDLVRVERLEDGSCRIEGLLPRRKALTRHGVARRREQVIVANVDQVAAVVAVTAPEPDFGMLDRLLVLAELNELRALIVLNKIDLAPGGTTPPDPFDPYLAAGYELLPTSARTRFGLERLDERLAGRVTVLAGQSGVGKSSLLNALDPGLELRVGEVGRRKRRGRHTTVAAALYLYPRGGWVADTPGLQYLALWEVDPAALADAFPELRPLAPACRFADCRHRTEPGCSVLEAVERGEVARRRYESYLTLLREAEEGR